MALSQELLDILACPKCKDDIHSLAHPGLYSTSAVNLVLPDRGVSLVNDDDWVDLGQQSMGGVNVSNFGVTNLPAGSVLEVDLEGEPDLEPTTAGTVSLDSQSELFIGIAAAAVVIVVAGVFVWRWRQEPVAAGDYEAFTREELLQALADLDDDYELGRIKKDRYHREREELKGELIALWEEEQSS